MDLNNDKTSNVSRWRSPPIWVSAIVTGVILLSIFIPYRKKLNHDVAPVIQMIQHVSQADR